MKRSGLLVVYLPKINHFLTPYADLANIKSGIK